MARTVIDFTHTLSQTQIEALYRPTSATAGSESRSVLRRFMSLLNGVIAGAYAGWSWTIYSGAVQATATLTFASTGPAADETFTICGTTFTAKSSGATGNQWNRSDAVATSAAALAAAVNASATAKVTGAVTATSALGVVTFTAKVPGTIGNGIEIAVGTLANTTLSSGGFTAGANGTSYTGSAA